MQAIQQALEASLEDFSISRSERKELKALLASTQGDQTEQAKVRQLAFRMATSAMGESGLRESCVVYRNHWFGE